MMRPNFLVCFTLLGLLQCGRGQLMPDGTCVFFDNPKPHLKAKRDPLAEGNGRFGSNLTAWELPGASGGRVYIESKQDIFSVFGSKSCCLEAAPEYASKPGGPPMVLSLPMYGRTIIWLGCKGLPADPKNNCAGHRDFQGIYPGPKGFKCPTKFNQDAGMKCPDLGDWKAKRIAQCGPYPIRTTRTPEPVARRRKQSKSRRRRRKNSRRRRRRRKSR